MDSPVVDTLNIVLTYIDQLPPEFKVQLSGHLEEMELEVFRDLCCGFNKLRADVLPAFDELDVIAHPSGVFKDVADGFRRAAVSAKIPYELENFINREIVAPLDVAADTFLVDPERAFIEWWFEHLRDNPNGPFKDQATPEPGAS